MFDVSWKYRTKTKSSTFDVHVHYKLYYFLHLTLKVEIYVSLNFETKLRYFILIMQKLYVHNWNSYLWLDMLSPVQVDVWWNYSLLNQFVFTSNQ